MGDSIRLLEDKINASKATFDIYQEEIAKIEKELKDKGIRIEGIEEQVDDLLRQMEELGKKEKIMLRKVKKTLERIEKRFK